MACIPCQQKRILLAQKKTWFRDKLEQVRKEAKQYAIQTQQTQAVYKEGSRYLYCDATATTGKTILEYISFHQ